MIFDDYCGYRNPFQITILWFILNEHGNNDLLLDEAGR